ncbi:MAG: hypothetical protein ABI599_07950 [Flavobacteriales bacterium]
MKRIIVPFLVVALAGSACAQTAGDTTYGNTSPEVFDTTAQQPDTARYATFGSMETVDATPRPSAAARAREERASARASGTPGATPSTGSSASRAGKAQKRTNGAELNIQRALDPEGRKHWKRMNKRSTRQAKGSPPGTVPVP